MKDEALFISIDSRQVWTYFSHAAPKTVLRAPCSLTLSSSSLEFASKLLRNDARPASASDPALLTFELLWVTVVVSWPSKQVVTVEDWVFLAKKLYGMIVVLEWNMS